MDFPISRPEDNKLLDQLTGKSKYKGFSTQYAVVYISLYIKIQVINM